MAMTDRPILFSAGMVRALLDGRKTQTRRVLTKLRRFGQILEFERSDTPGYDWHFRDRQMRWHDLRHAKLLSYLPFAVGDRLYVREAWRTAAHLDRFSPKLLPVDTPVFFEADAGGDAIGATGKFRQGMHMPRWASRLTVTVTDVRVQRLQAISPEDAIREGYPFDAPPAESRGTYIFWYRDLWDSLNDKPERPGCAWRDNPWVVAVSFTVERRNIDEVRS
jgi:hypothetical protein